jgi:hypothetical protein
MDSVLIGRFADVTEASCAVFERKMDAGTSLYWSGYVRGNRRFDMNIGLSRLLLPLVAPRPRPNASCTLLKFLAGSIDARQNTRRTRSRRGAGIAEEEQERRPLHADTESPPIARLVSCFRVLLCLRFARRVDPSRHGVPPPPKICRGAASVLETRFDHQG